MKTLLTLLAVAALAAAPAAFADSPAVAAAFAAATPTRYEGSATFYLDDQESGNIRYRSYVFVMDASFRVTSLVIDGRKIVGICDSTPLAGLPYPLKGAVTNFRLSLQAWDDLSPAQPHAPTGSATVTGGSSGHSSSVTVVGETVIDADAALPPPTLDAETSSVGLAKVKIVAESGDITISGTPVSANSSRPAGTGYAEHDVLNRGDVVTVWLTPAELVRFLPVAEMVGPEGWSLVVGNGTTSGAVQVNGQWGFWVFLDSTASWGYSFWLQGPGGFMDFGSLDLDDPPKDGASLALAAVRAGGVEVVDLRQTWPRWKLVSSTIDGQFSAGEGYSTGPSHNGEAVAVRNDPGAVGLNVYYAGPAAYVIVRELDDAGAETKNGDGTPREWLLSPGGANYGSTESSLSGFVPTQTGRASVLIVPATQNSRFGAYDLLVESVENGKG